MDQEGPAIQVVLRDITQRKRLQEQLRRTERVAELGTLASGMAHEIGTPMNVILGRAEYLMNRTNDEPIKKGLQTIVSQVERITRVMNQLLSFARRETPERRAVNLKEVIENSLEMFHERFSRHHIEIELDCEQACPPVHADADQMSQVLINLVMNAVHAMPDGGRLRIAVRRLDRNMVELTIADTGSGMPPGGAGKDLRSVLHDEGVWGGHRLGPDRGQGHHGGARRNDRGQQRAGPGHDVHACSCRRMSGCSVGGPQIVIHGRCSFVHNCGIRQHNFLGDWGLSRQRSPFYVPLLSGPLI